MGELELRVDFKNLGVEEDDDQMGRPKDNNKTPHQSRAKRIRARADLSDPIEISRAGVAAL